MRRLGLLLVVVGLLWAAPRMAAFASIGHYADPHFGEHVRFDYTDEGTGWSGGGPFKGTLFHTAGASDVWKTFCVESDGGAEYINLGTTYQVWGTDLHWATGTYNYITDAAKWLYYQSWHNPGLLPGYVPDSIVSDSRLQQAIWHGVRLGGPSGSPLNMPFGSLAQTWFNLASAATEGEEGWADADLVWVLNPASLNYHGMGCQVQSMLYEVPQEPPVIPEPATIIIWSLLGLGSVFGMRVWRR